MNKELIKKYKTEFDHWLNDGKLLGIFNFTNIKNYKPEPWFEFEETKWSLTSFEYLSIIIEDEYVELRKALAEGKTIQVCNKFQGDWIDIDKPEFTGCVEYYRIKPEEPQFKVGDFVRDIISGKVSQVKNEDIVNGVYSQVIKWEPQAGELCWFADSLDENIAHLGNYKFKNDENYVNGNYVSWKYCEPFLNSKPSWFKD